MIVTWVQRWSQFWKQHKKWLFVAIAVTVISLMHCHLNSAKQVEKTCRSENYSLRYISQMRKYLYVDQIICKSLVHAFVSPNLDYLNLLLFSVPNSLIKRLQKTRNTAARILKGERKRLYMRELHHDIHWLPVIQRIKFEILLLAFRASQFHKPVYLPNLLSRYHPACTICSTDQVGS